MNLIIFIRPKIFILTTSKKNLNECLLYITLFQLKPFLFPVVLIRFKSYPEYPDYLINCSARFVIFS